MKTGGLKKLMVGGAGDEVETGRANFLELVG
jgi:hypothetical protein